MLKERSTIDLARRHGAGTLLINRQTAQVFKVSDYSPGTGDVYGWPASDNGNKIGRYQKIPGEGLERVL